MIHFHRMMDGASKLKCWGAEFGDAIIKHMGSGGPTAGAGKPAMAMA